MTAGCSPKAKEHLDMGLAYLKEFRKAWDLGEGWIQTIQNASTLFEQVNSNVDRYRHRSRLDFEVLHQSAHEFRTVDRFFEYQAYPVHSDDFFTPHRAIAPGMQVAVNYRYARDAEDLKQGDNTDPNAPEDSHVYSRYTNPNTSRLEMILRNVFRGHVVTYSSGLSAFHALIVCVNPKRVFIGQGYHGIHGVIEIMSKLTGVKKLTLEDLDQLQAGDIVHVETPLNPTGEATNLAYYSEKAHAAGAYLSVDATFAPPPLQDPLQLGADVVMHSGTKYIGGHSDMLCGILVVRQDRVKEGWVDTLYKERQIIGSVMGSFEGWLGIRSLQRLTNHVQCSLKSFRHRPD
ncbi:hypothetical protein K4K57_002829 [Colletotrichum sp. SAR 10_99]|nr:hypothetical protein K4K55_002677 [Colletotrichum sp. SAR 10_96]KAJ5013380.1 hypothetical protein K4K57_002829 [Colletotrichum sp. SAR 10_99]